MDILQKDFEELLNQNVSKEISIPLLTKEVAHTLLDRIKNIQLYAHSYSFILHAKHTNFQVSDLLAFAHGQGLSGIAVNINKFHLTSVKWV